MEAERLLWSLWGREKLRLRNKLLFLFMDIGGGKELKKQRIFA